MLKQLKLVAAAINPNNATNFLYFTMFYLMLSVGFRGVTGD